MKPSIKLLLLLILCCPVQLFAELPKQIELDFSVVSGYIIMPINDEYLVDLDDRDNLHVGDILTMVTPGKKIFHPVTKELLGSVDIPVGFLQVTRINSGYSYVKVLTKDLKPPNGAQLRRFEQVPALLVDSKGDDGTLARQIMTDLPQFKWLQNVDQQPLLILTLQADSLEVKTADGDSLHRYEVKDNQQLEAPRSTAKRPFVAGKTETKPKLISQMADSVLSTLHLKDDDAFSAENLGVIRQGSLNQRGVWIGPNIEGNPVGLAVADLDGDGLQETAVALENKLLIGQINQKQYTEKSDVEIPRHLQILSLDVFDLDKNGRPELYLTAVDEHRMASFVVEYRDGEYTTTIKRLRWYLRVVELPGQGAVLVGQFMGDDKNSFSGTPFQVRFDDGKLARGEKFTLPDLANIYSFMPFTDKENNAYTAYLTKDDYLKVVSADGVELWESEAYYGGSESCFYNREDNPKAELVIPTCLGPRLLKNGDSEILVAQNDGQRIMQRFNKYNRSRVLSMVWNGSSLTESWRTAGQSGYLADFSLADANNDGSAELVMAIKFKHEGAIDKARSSIVTYRLD